VRIGCFVWSYFLAEGVSLGIFCSVVQRAYYPPLTVRVGCFVWSYILAEGVSLGNLFSVVQRAYYPPLTVRVGCFVWSYFLAEGVSPGISFFRCTAGLLSTFDCARWLLCLELFSC
jgi:hypothetical protein